MPWPLALLLVLQVPCVAAPQRLPAANPHQVEAAFLRNFARYVTWPSQAHPEAQSPWQVGVLGPDPFGEALEASVKGRTEQGRAFEIFRAATLEELPPCHIIFIAYSDAEQRRAVLGRLEHQPVLTVSEAPDFLQEGGMIVFHVDERVAMSINLDRARAAALTIQTKMLEVSKSIVENGVARSRR